MNENERDAGPRPQEAAADKTDPDREPDDTLLHRSGQTRDSWQDRPRQREDSPRPGAHPAEADDPDDSDDPNDSDDANNLNDPDDPAAGDTR